MTENENIKKILYMGVGRSGLENESSIIAKALSELMEYRAIGTVEQFEWCKDTSHWKELFKEKLEQYEAIGTIEEFKALKEKNEPRKPDYEGDGYYNGQIVLDTWICPNCRKEYEVDYDDYDFCPNCGQHIDHSGLTEDD